MRAARYAVNAPNSALGREMERQPAHPAEPGLTTLAGSDNSPRTILAGNVTTLAEVGIGIAWASILAMPYAILASNLPQAKLGIYMGLFNVFVVVPQLLVATVMGSIMQAFFPGEPVWTMLFAAASWLVAALAMQRVRAAIPS